MANVSLVSNTSNSSHTGARERITDFGVKCVEAAQVSSLLLEVIDPAVWVRTQYADIVVLIDAFGDDLTFEKWLSFVRAIQSGALKPAKPVNFRRLRQVWDFRELEPMRPVEQIVDELDARLRAAEH